MYPSYDVNSSHHEYTVRSLSISVEEASTNDSWEVHSDEIESFNEVETRIEK